VANNNSIIFLIPVCHNRGFLCGDEITTLLLCTAVLVLEKQLCTFITAKHYDVTTAGAEMNSRRKASVGHKILTKYIIPVIAWQLQMSPLQ